jgi:hypothetical protein
MSVHAPKAPSFATIWGECSGAIAASAGRLDKTNARTVQGTAAHWVMEQCARNWRSSEVEADLFCSIWVGRVDPGGTVITDEIAEGAQVILDNMLHAVNKFGGYRYLLVEQRVAMTQIHPTDNWGTLDLGYYNPTHNNGQGLLIVWDYKHGYSLVRAKGNLQLVDYVEGLYESFAIPTGTEVRLRIVQPFAYASWGPVDEWVGTLSDLFPLFAQLKAKAHEADTDPKLTAGKHCRYCPGRLDCSAARQYTRLWSSIADMPYEMDRMTLDDKAKEIDFLHAAESVIKSRRDALSDDLHAAMSSGKPCEVKVLEAVQGAAGWVKGQEAAAIAAFQSIGVDIRKTTPLTPRQALQKVPKEAQAIGAAIVTGLTVRKMKTQLVDRADSYVSRAFGKKQPTGE